MLQQTTTAKSVDNQLPVKSVLDDMDPISSTSFSEVPPSACSTFTEDPTTTDNQHMATTDDAADGTWTSSSLFDAAATTTTAAVTVDSRDMAFVLTESSEAPSSAATASMAADTASTGVSTQPDDNDSREEMNGGQAEPADTETWQHTNDDDDDDVRKDRICLFLLGFNHKLSYVHQGNLLYTGCYL